MVYTLEDDTGAIPVHWLAHEKRPKEIKPPALPAGEVIVTGRVRQEVELEGKRYPLLIHELTELHNQERPTLPAAPVLQ